MASKIFFYLMALETEMDVEGRVEKNELKSDLICQKIRKK